MTPQEVPHFPALGRGVFDRAADERPDPELVERLRADSDSRVIVVHGDRAPLTSSGAVAYVAPGALDGVTDATWAFLGRDRHGRALLLCALDDAAAIPMPAASWGALRAVGGQLPAEDADVFVTALSLGRWLIDSPHCPRCGSTTRIRSGGWARVCESCGREHFPRTDPAVIVAITDRAGERLLLGKNAMWAERNMYSAFAGFVEAGESVESTIVREIHEEAGVLVSDIRYRGSQAWPYPRSLMLGFHATAIDADAARPDGEEIVDVRWFDRDTLRRAFEGSGEIALPGAASIANGLIRDWLAQ